MQHQYPAEIMPTAMRPVGVAVAYMMQHILIIILVQFTPQAIETISWRFFLIFVCSSAISFVIFVLFYPETRNRTLEELAAVFGDEVCTFKYVSQVALTVIQVAETLDEAGQHIEEKEGAMGTHVETVK
jgi:uncharacterized membrane protein YccC